MKTLCITFLGLLAVCLTGCGDVKSFGLAVDNGRSKFVRHDYVGSQASCSQAVSDFNAHTHKSTMALTWDEISKLATRGAYVPMYRDVLTAYFYLALNALAQQRPAEAFANLNRMLGVHDQIARQYAEPAENELSDEMKAKDMEQMLSFWKPVVIPENATAEERQQLKAYALKMEQEKKKSERAFNVTWNKAAAELRRTDRYANKGLSDFYNHAALLLTAFLAGWNDTASSKELVSACLTTAQGHAPATEEKLWNCLESSGSFQNKVFVIVATGHGPVLSARNINVNGITGTTVFAYTDLHTKNVAMAEMNPGFNPLAPLAVHADSEHVHTEVATELFASLNAEYQQRKSRLLREQVIRVLIKDAIAVTIAIIAEKQWGKEKGIPWIALAIAGSHFFLRQLLMTPELRCMENAPWAYQVALVEMPSSRQLRLKTNGVPRELTASIPPACNSAVVYVDFPGGNGKASVRVLPISMPSGGGL
ncbi:MAG: hypothetical protein IJS08_19015 [Victivallales bacterium]|nr:hypothetical protein [Victivallales bacterium]